MPEQGGLSSRKGRGRALSLSIPTTTPPSTPPQPIARGFPPSSLPDSPPPLEDCSPPRRPLRQPHTMPHCLQPYGHFPAPPPYAFHDSNAPQHYKDSFPPNYNTLCLCVIASVTQTKTYTPPESFPLDPLLPTPYLTPSHHQSLMTLMCSPQTPLIMIVI